MAMLVAERLTDVGYINIQVYIIYLIRTIGSGGQVVGAQGENKGRRSDIRPSGKIITEYIVLLLRLRLDQEELNEPHPISVFARA